MTSVLTLSSVKGHGALTALRGHPLLGPRTLGCGCKGRRVILWTDGSEPGARRGTPLGRPIPKVREFTLGHNLHPPFHDNVHAPARSRTSSGCPFRLGADEGGTGCDDV
eukprot:1167319-Prymnesium_polylepis.1